MAEAEGIGPRDLLKRLMCGGSDFPTKFAGGEEEEGENVIELSLGLSLNGRFGVDPAKKLIRASSVANYIVGGEESAAGGGAAYLSPYAPLTRACSLPTQPEEEWRKKKELQSLRRLEAKRKRVEKMKNGRVVKGKIEQEENCGGCLPNSGSEWVESKLERGSSSLGEFEGVKLPQFISQGSIGSQGSGGSSGVSDFESQPLSGSNRDSGAKSPGSEHSMPDLKQASSPSPCRGTTNAGPSKAVSSVAPKGEADEMVKSMLADMPCVSTKGEGPNGRKIEGFLYRYRKGEEVRIVCVCHGSFLTPAEFVKHGGGGDVAHPLRHIVVNPPSLC